MQSHHFIVFAELDISIPKKPKVNKPLRWNVAELRTDNVRDSFANFASFNKAAWEHIEDIDKLDATIASSLLAAASNVPQAFTCLKTALDQ